MRAGGLPFFEGEADAGLLDEVESGVEVAEVHFFLYLNYLY